MKSINPVYDSFWCRVISTEEGKRLADSWNAIFVESSAKQNEVSHTVIVYIYITHYTTTIKCTEYHTIKPLSVPP